MLAEKLAIASRISIRDGVQLKGIGSANDKGLGKGIFFHWDMLGSPIYRGLSDGLKSPWIVLQIKSMNLPAMIGVRAESSSGHCWFSDGGLDGSAGGTGVGRLKTITRITAVLEASTNAPAIESFFQFILPTLTWHRKEPCCADNRHSLFHVPNCSCEWTEKLLIHSAEVNITIGFQWNFELA